MYYRSEGKSVCADVIPYYENGKFYLYYLKDYRDVENYGNGISWYLVTTEDFVTYEEHGEVLPHGTADDQDLRVFTGSCSKFNGEYYIFYTGDNFHRFGTERPAEKVLLAKSNDLILWNKVEDFELAAPESLDMHDFRDPFVNYDEEKQKYCMLLAGRVKNDEPGNSKGVTLQFLSDDLQNWELAERLFFAPSAFFTHECPDLFKMGDWWYLIFSEYNDKVVTTYRMAKSQNGPWITPKVDTFDGSPYYAAKTVSDGEHRYLLGWNRLLDEEKDDGSCQWGGTIVPHELVQDEDGSLFVKCPESIRNMYNVPVELEDGYTLRDARRVEDGCTLRNAGKFEDCGTLRDAGNLENGGNLNDARNETNNWLIGSNDNRSIKLFGKMPQNCKIELDFTTTDEVGEFGVLLRADIMEDTFYAVKFEPKHNRLAYDKRPRKSVYEYTMITHERYCPLEPGQKNHMVIIAEGSVLEVYVNDRVAMSARMFDHKEGEFGVYTQNTSVLFENIVLKVKK